MFVHRPIYIVQCSHQVYGVFLINVIQFGCAMAHFGIFIAPHKSVRDQRSLVTHCHCLCCHYSNAVISNHPTTAKYIDATSSNRCVESTTYSSPVCDEASKQVPVEQLPYSSPILYASIVADSRAKDQCGDRNNEYNNQHVGAVVYSQLTAAAAADSVHVVNSNVYSNIYPH